MRLKGDPIIRLSCCCIGSPLKSRGIRVASASVQSKKANAMNAKMDLPNLITIFYSD